MLLWKEEEEEEDKDFLNVLRKLLLEVLLMLVNLFLMWAITTKDQSIYLQKRERKKHTRSFKTPQVNSPVITVVVDEYEFVEFFPLPPVDDDADESFLTIPTNSNSPKTLNKLLCFIILLLSSFSFISLSVTSEVVGFKFCKSRVVNGKVNRFGNLWWSIDIICMVR